MSRHIPLAASRARPERIERDPTRRGSRRRLTHKSTFNFRTRCTTALPIRQRCTDWGRQLARARLRLPNDATVVAQHQAARLHARRVRMRGSRARRIDSPTGALDALPLSVVTALRVESFPQIRRNRVAPGPQSASCASVRALQGARCAVVCGPRSMEAIVPLFMFVQVGWYVFSLPTCYGYVAEHPPPTVAAGTVLARPNERRIFMKRNTSKIRNEERPK